MDGALTAFCCVVSLSSRGMLRVHSITQQAPEATKSSSQGKPSIRIRFQLGAESVLLSEVFSLWKVMVAYATEVASGVYFFPSATVHSTSPPLFFLAGAARTE
jgi:hypothetical protein